ASAARPCAERNFAPPGLTNRTRLIIDCSTSPPDSIMTSAHASRRLRVWDLPTCMFHWPLVLSVVGSYVTDKAGGLWMDWHVRFGLFALGLLAFRLVWGLIGGYYSRFARFLPNPARSLNYLRERPAVYPGHNPIGAWSVWAMLIVFGF